MRYQLFDTDVGKPVSLAKGPRFIAELAKRLRELERVAPGRFAMVRLPVLVRDDGVVLEASEEVSMRCYEEVHSHES